MFLHIPRRSLPRAHLLLRRRNLRFVFFLRLLPFGTDSPFTEALFPYELPFPLSIIGRDSARILEGGGGGKGKVGERARTESGEATNVVAGTYMAV